MKMNKIIIILALLIVITTGCEDVLDKSPLDQVTSADFFKSKNDLKIYVNKFYESNLLFEYINNWAANSRTIYTHEAVNSDNQLFNGYIDEVLNGQRTALSSNDAYSRGYSLVRSINYLFDNYEKVEDSFDEYKQYLGEAYFFRALIFNQLLQKYGDIVWLDYVPDENSDILYGERMARNEVMDKILADLDSAVVLLSEDEIDGGTRVNKWTALAYQSRIALYEGTWEKYHANDAFAAKNPAPDKYLQKAAQAAEEIMNSGKFSVYTTGHPDTDYYDFFNLHDYSGNNSVLMWKQYSVDLGIINRRMYDGRFPSEQGLTKELIDSYLCTDGKPISVSSLFLGHDTITNEMANRDPRMLQTVWGPDAPWEITADTTIYWSAVWNKLFTGGSNYIAATGYCMRKGYSANVETQNNNGEDFPDVLFRYAEVLLNYAEAKAELGSISQADINKTIKLLRDRVGMPNLDLATISNDPNWDFPTLSPVINEIRRERRVELASEGNRWFDIQRWAAADELIAGHRPKGIKASQLPEYPFPVDAEGFLDPLADALGENGYGFNVGRDYLYPIPPQELALNPKLTQNPGWE